MRPHVTSGERTLSVHGRSEPRRGPLVTPIHQTSTFVLESARDVDDVYEGRRAGDVYSRYTNPSLASVASRIAALEGTEAALVSASGMGAITATVLALVGAGGRVVATQDLYGGTLKLFSELEKRFAVRVDRVPTTDPEALRAALREKADLVYLETPTNPTLRLVDLARSAEIARAAGVLTAVDSTFASPVNTRPADLGIDIVLHSATKYLGGHSDLTAGAICASRETIARIEPWHRTMGATLDPHAAFLLERGIRTLPLRVHAANAGAQRLAEHLDRHPAVQRVHYPGLPSHPQHALAKRQMRGFGGLLSFDLATLDDAKRFLDGLRLVRNAASLGGVESLVSLPVQQSHRHQPPHVLATAGITPGTVRLALGIEDAEDVIADVDQALAPLGKVSHG
ncbi:MAG TPA: aminotransferase class I/II-fold pyridoxal phosphate-dependent enzyme [Candidatus Thermoplasmatota archaeon]|nr:aminotransferase class I/II-fold pyridoxal phosphate-dependent enzyme [Candidatus Thermoplasmatota archaeon]